MPALDRRQALTLAAAGALAIPSPAPAAVAAPADALAGAPLPALLRALATRLEAEAAGLHAALADDPRLPASAAEAGCDSPRAYLTALQVTGLLDGLDAALSLSWPEKTQIWGVVGRQAAGRLAQFEQFRTRRAAESAAA